MRGPNPKESEPLTLTLSPEYKGEGTRKLLNPVPFNPDPFTPKLKLARALAQDCNRNDSGCGFVITEVKPYGRGAKQIDTP